MNSKLLLVAAVLALGGGLVWLRIQSKPPGLASDVQIDDRISKSVDDPAGSAPLLETPLAPQTEPSATGLKVDAERSAATVDTIDFDAKYGSWTLERLEEAHAVSRKELARVVTEVFDERMKQGKFEESIVKAGEPGPSSDGWNRVSGEGIDGGLVRYRNVKLPLDEYPLVNSIWQETSWLQKRLQALHGPSKR